MYIYIYNGFPNGRSPWCWRNTSGLFFFLLRWLLEPGRFSCVPWYNPSRESITSRRTWDGMVSPHGPNSQTRNEKNRLPPKKKLRGGDCFIYMFIFIFIFFGGGREEMNFTIFGEEFCVYKYCLLYIKQPFCVECLHQIDRLGLSRLKRSFFCCQIWLGAVYGSSYSWAVQKFLKRTSWYGKSDHFCKQEFNIWN